MNKHKSTQASITEYDMSMGIRERTAKRARAKSRGQMNYEADVKAWPYYSIGRMIPRVGWDELHPAVQANWESERPGWHAANAADCKARGLHILVGHLECGNLTLDEGLEVAAAFGVLTVGAGTAQELAEALRPLAY